MVVLERNHAKPGSYRIRKDGPHSSEGDNQMFIVVRNTKSTVNNQDYEMGVGDIIKLGRIKFKVRAMAGCS